MKRWLLSVLVCGFANSSFAGWLIYCHQDVDGDNVGSGWITTIPNGYNCSGIGTQVASSGAFEYDNCPTVPNADQLDSDADGIGDVCDPTPAFADSDQDSLENALDNCPYNANPDQLDTDNDGMGNACDSDLDGDGIANTADNCPLLANSDQLDTDADGAGDVCDNAAYDNDGDGISNVADNCPAVANADQLDVDGDLKGDACDPDSDNDGVNDVNDRFPFDPTESQDTDLDGVGDNADNCDERANPDQADTNTNGAGDVCEPTDVGYLNSQFDPGSGANELVYAMALQPDGKVLVGGLFTVFDGRGRSRLARLHPDGTLDVTFNAVDMQINNYIAAIALQSDGKIVIGGEFTTVDGVSRNHVARLHPDGSLDTSFDVGTLIGFYNRIESVRVQPDGKIIVAGSSVAKRFNHDGSLDCNFNLDTNGTVFTSALQADGKVLLGGQFYSMQGLASPDLARMNADCSIDNSFTRLAQSDMDQVRAISVLGNGKIVIAGLADYSYGKIMRRNPDGTPDSSFSLNPRPKSVINGLVVQPDGKLLVAGNFTKLVSNSVMNRVARYNANGLLDQDFNHGVSANAEVRAMLVQPTGKLLIAGAFTAVDGVSRAGVAALNTGDTDADQFDDAADVFPLDPAESIDTDADGIGNNADLDDDNDGFPDNIDLNPLDPAITDYHFSLEGTYKGSSVRDSISK